MIPTWRAHFGEKMMRTYITNGERTIYTSKDDADFLVEALNRSAKVECIAIPPSRFYSGTIQDEISRAQIHGPNALTLEALETTLARAEAAERDFIQVHKNCIEARARAEKAEAALSEKVESDPLGEEPTHFELARTRTLRKRIADIVATHDAFVADATNPARAYELRDAVDRARAIGLTRAEMAQYQDYDCPHAAPHRYCETCKVDPCPLGFKHKDRIVGRTRRR